jgi:hypothetical protein
MQFSTDQRHAETLAFLAEVRDYLASWPAHPANRDMLAKIDGHLADPQRRLVQEGTYLRTGANYTAAGREVLRAKLQGETVTITAPPRGIGSIADSLLIRRLRQGERITLSRVAELHDGLSLSELSILRQMK